MCITRWGAVFLSLALEKEFIKADIPNVKEEKINVFYNEEKLKKFFKADFVCFDKIIVEVKAQKIITNADLEQVRNYLSATKKELAYLVNFGAPKLFYKRIINTQKSV